MPPGLFLPGPGPLSKGPRLNIEATGGGNVTVDMTGVVAIAFASGINPTKLIAKVFPTFALANASASSTFQEVARTTATVAIASGSGINPTKLIARVTAVRAIANASALVPTKETVRTSGTPIAIANATAFPGTPAALDVVVKPPAAIANGSGITPTKLIVKVFPPPAIANASAIPPGTGPTIQTAVPAIARATSNVAVPADRVTAVRANAVGAGTVPTKLSVRVFAVPAIARVSARPPFDPTTPVSTFHEIRHKRRFKPSGDKVIA